MAKGFSLKAEVVKTKREMEIATLRLPTHFEHCVAFHSCGDPNRALRSVLQERNAVVLSQFVFAGNSLYSELISNAGGASTDGGFCSMQAVALSGIIPQPVLCGGRKIGFTYEDGCARYCRLSGLLPADSAASRAAQARSAFERAATALAQNGFRFADAVRTWIYLDRLLEWYDEFNAVRNAFFKEAEIHGSRVPASTGIGAGNPFGAALTMDVFAVQPKISGFTVRAVASPLQNPALDYNSSFSRAVELGSPTHRKLLLSGTASIAPDGKTVHQDEPEKQIRRTMDVVKAMLESREMNWKNLFRGVAYFKDMALLPIYRRVASELDIPRFPLAIARADICRRDLVFEIEADAVRTCPSGATEAEMKIVSCRLPV